MNADWLKELLTIFLGSGAAFAFLEFLKEKRHRKDTADYLALQIAFNLEGYSIECAKLLSNHRVFVDSGGHAGDKITAVPKLSPLPDSDAYKLLDRSILNEIMDFPQRCSMAQESAGFWWDIAGDEDAYITAVEENTLKMGMRSVEIAIKVRAVNNLVLRELSFDGWNINEFYQRELERVKAAEKRREDESLRMNRMMSDLSEKD